MRPKAIWCAGFFLALSLNGCANFNTIDRTTELAFKGGKGKDAKTGSGRAVHLDIQQRLAMVNHLGTICTEPSPDALASYAASVGVAAGDPVGNTGSISGATSSNAASIGLRTQSITLMRDALYRMCEAYANDQMSAAQVTTFLSRSQDLTAVVLAVEQLTGPVVARQAQLASTASARATSAVNNVSRLVAITQARIERINSDIDRANDKKTALETERNKIDSEITKKTEQSDNEQNLALQAQIDREIETLRTNLTNTGLLIANESNKISRLDEQLKIEQERLSKLQEKQDQVLTDTAAETGGTATLTSENIAGANTDIAKTAEAVKEIVTTVLNKDYTAAGCLALITTPIDSGDVDPKTRTACIELLAVKVGAEKQEQLDEINEKVRRSTRKARPRPSSAQCVREWLPKNQPSSGNAVRDYLARRQINVSTLMSSEEELRRLINETPIEECK